MHNPARRLLEAASLAGALCLATQAQALDRPQQQVLIESRFLEVTAGISRSTGDFDLDTSFGNNVSKSFSRTREFIGLSGEVPIFDLGGPQVVVGADGRFFLDTTMLNFSFDMHPTAGNDVHARVTNHVQVTPFLGVDFPLNDLVGDAIEQARLRILGGATIGDYKNTLRIDETGGTGNRERFSESGVRVAPTIGAELILDGLVRGGPVDVGLKLGGQVTSGKVPVLSDISGLGFAYRAKAREEARVQLMVIITPRIIIQDEEE